ncbi:peroxisomal membrane protein PEX14-like [Rhopilema esculentum]|uniref:peroxisomal membrane protein PEX14-like n=1 Tax=Rhopilema esculentum TaxID=499914 RepID=UPI0031D5758D
MAEEADKEVDNEVKEELSQKSIDEKKIATAVKFLQNPNVRKTTFENRLSFLKRKGLTEKEIEIAVGRSGTKDDKDVKYTTEITRSEPPKNDAAPISTVPYTQPTSSSFASQLSSVVIGGGILYAAAYAIRVYVVPYFLGKEIQETESLEENIKQLTKGVNELSSIMKSTFTTLEENLKNQQATLAEVSAELAVSKKRLDLLPSDITSLSDVKSEISSVKSLLLSRSQFPGAPFAPASTSPSIPAWQKVSRKEKTEDARDQSAETKPTDNPDKEKQEKEESQEADSAQ